MVLQDNSLQVIDLIENGNSTLVKELIDSGYDVNINIEDGLTPLILAASCGNLEIVKLLIEAGANVDYIDADGTNPLMCAASERFWHIFDYLAPLTSSDIKGIGLLTSTFDGELEIIKALINTGINVDAHREKGVWSENGRTALIIAIREGYLEVSKILLEAGADPNLIDEDSGTTPLISAVRGNHTQIVRLLLKAGANTNTRDSNEATALDIAKRINNNEIISLLIEAETKN